MDGAHFTFETEAFTDSAEVLAQNVNGIAGHALATLIAAGLKNAGFSPSDIWPEDHGWDFSVVDGDAKYLCSCSLATEDGAPFEAHVTLAKPRSMMDRMRGRNVFAKDDAVAAAIRSQLAARTDVSKFAVSF